MSLLTIITGCDKYDELFYKIEKRLDSHWIEIQNTRDSVKKSEMWNEINNNIRYNKRVIDNKIETLERRIHVLRNETECLKREIEVLKSKNNVNITLDQSCLQKQIDELKAMIKDK